eukprot:2905402-Amphidinium_carterae.1
MGSALISTFRGYPRHVQVSPAGFELETVYEVVDEPLIEVINPAEPKTVATSRRTPALQFCIWLCMFLQELGSRKVCGNHAENL